ncbi:MAG: hypothetical protein ACRC9U_00835 [Metamycoplasmataceae bacterium]
MKKKEKKEKNNKKSIKQFFSNLNSSNEIKRGDVVVNPKDKRVKWFFGAGILAITALGIGLPLGLTQQIIKAEEPMSPDKDIVGGINGGTTVGDILDHINSLPNKEFTKYMNEYQNLSTQYLYVQERAAYQGFAAFLKNTKFKNDTSGPGDEAFGYNVSKPLTEIRKEAQAQLDKDRTNYKNSNPGTWEAGWKNELLTNEKYGLPLNSNTGNNANENINYIESLVVNFLTSQRIKEVAFAPFQSAEFNSESWIFSDLSLKSNEIINYDIITPVITVKDDGSWTVTEEIKEKTGVIGVGEAYLDTKYQFNKAADYVYFNGKENNTSPSATSKITVYQTKSYLPGKRNPIPAFSQIFSKAFRSVSMSTVDLNLSLNAEGNWVFPKETFLKLVTAYEYNDSTGKVQIGLPIADLINFLGVSSFIEGTAPNITNINRDEALIKTLGTATTPPPEGSSTKEGENTLLGQMPVTKVSDLLKSKENTNRYLNMVALTSGNMAGDTWEGAADPTKALFKAAEVNILGKLLFQFLNYTVNASTPEWFTQLRKLVTYNFTITPDTTTEVSTIDLSNGMITTPPTTDANSPFFVNADMTKYNKFISEVEKIIVDTEYSNIFLSKINQNSILQKTFYDNAQWTSGNFVDQNFIFNPKKWTLYKLSANTFMYMGNEGSKIYSINKVDEQNMPKMINNALRASFYTANSDLLIGQPSWYGTDFFEINKMYDNLKNDDLINGISYNQNQADTPGLVINNNWLTILKNKIKQTNANLTDAELVQKATELRKQIGVKLNGQINLNLSKGNSDAMQGLTELINTVILPENSYDFYRSNDLNDGFWYWKLNNGIVYDPAVNIGGNENFMMQQVNDKIKSIVIVNFGQGPVLPFSNTKGKGK